MKIPATHAERSDEMEAVHNVVPKTMAIPNMNENI